MRVVMQKNKWTSWIYSSVSSILFINYTVYVCVDLIHNQLIGFNFKVMEVHSRAAPACFSLYWLGFKSGLAEIELSKIVKNVDSRISNQAICDDR